MVKGWPEPTWVNEVYQFLGLANYYCQFVFGFSRVAAPLTKLLRGKNQFSFGEAQRQAFQQLKDALVGAPILRMYNPDVDIRVLIYASRTTVGAVLEQLFDGVWHPIECFSKWLSDAEEQYCATEREMLGIILSIQRQRPYLISRIFKVLTDHAPNQYFNDQAKLSQTQVCCLEVNAEYDVQFEYVPCCKHSILDELSRQSQLHNVLSINSDKALQEAIAVAQKKSIDPTITQHLIEGMAQGDGYMLKNSMLCKEDSNRVRIVIPSDALNLKQQMLKELHESVFGGHLGARKLSCPVSNQFAWTSIESDIRNYCRQYSIC